MRFLTFLLLFPLFLFSQEISYSVLDIPANLKENANAVIRFNQIDIAVLSQRRMIIKQKRVITVLNDYGLHSINAAEYYDKNRKIVKIEAKVFDAFGKEIKSIKKRDFKDVSVGDGFSVFTDNRMLYLDYTPINYPFTVLYESEMETSNTAFIPNWSPLEGYFLSAQKTIFNLSYPKELGFQKKETNFSDQFPIVRTETANSIKYSAENITALKSEENSPDFVMIVPSVYLKVQKFNLEGIDGEASDWEGFGKWYYDSILSGTDELTVETQDKIKALVGTEKDPVKIAKIIYHYVQGKTRYVSIQVGIGGFKPMLAKDVDRLGYGDCKALVNYTRALLNVVGVPSYYTIVYAGSNKKGLHEDFASVQGNHIILALPTNKELIWLECTSQIQPFGYQGDFTDDRNVLMVKPDGGELVKTKIFVNTDNSQISKGKFSISEKGELLGSLSITSTGSQYNSSFSIERLAPDEKEKHFKSYFGSINNLKIDNISFTNDADKIVFVENVALSAESYADAKNNKLMFVLNAFNNYQKTPKRYRTRENAFEIRRGYFDKDEIVITTPENYSVEAMPNNMEIKNKFGTYQMEIINRDDNSMIYKRSLLINEGFYESNEYEEYRLFREQVARNDNAKIVLTKKN
jgi:hypothetical protein